MGDHVAIAYSTSSEDDVDEVTIPEEPMAPLCDGTPRRLWVGKYVVLHRADGFPIAKGICRNVSSEVVVGSSGPLGDSHMAIQISSSLSMADVPDEWRYSIRAWPIEFVFYNSASFRDHELRAQYNLRIAELSTGPALTRSRPYTSTPRNPPRPTTTKSECLLRQQNINFVSTRDCCSQHYAQIFPRDKHY